MFVEAVRLRSSSLVTMLMADVIAAPTRMADHVTVRLTEPYGTSCECVAKDIRLFTEDGPNVPQ